MEFCSKRNFRMREIQPDWKSFFTLQLSMQFKYLFRISVLVLMGCSSNPSRRDLHPLRFSGEAPPKANPVGSISRKVANQNYQVGNCEIDQDTVRAIEILRKTRTVANTWPEFALSDIKVVLTDGKHNRRSLLVNFSDHDLQSVNIKGAKCSNHPDVFWAKNRPIPQRTSNLIIQCSTSHTTEEWIDYRCDFFPELQKLFDLTQKDIDFYQLPNPKYQKLIDKFLKEVEDPIEIDLVKIQTSTVIHEYFHSHQGNIEFNLKPERIYGKANRSYFNDCTTDIKWVDKLKSERLKFKDLFKRFRSMPRSDLIEVVRAIVAKRNEVPEDKACWDSFRYYERWEGIADYVSYLALLRAKAIGWQHVVDFSIMNNIQQESFYSSGMFWGFILDKITKNSSWKVQVNSGYYPDLVVQDMLSSGRAN